MRIRMFHLDSAIKIIFKRNKNQSLISINGSTCVFMKFRFLKLKKYFYTNQLTILNTLSRLTLTSFNHNTKPAQLYTSKDDRRARQNNWKLWWMYPWLVFRNEKRHIKTSAYSGRTENDHLPCHDDHDDWELRSCSAKIHSLNRRLSRWTHRFWPRYVVVNGGEVRTLAALGDQLNRETVFVFMPESTGGKAHIRPPRL